MLLNLIKSRISVVSLYRSRTIALLLQDSRCAGVTSSLCMVIWVDTNGHHISLATAIFADSRYYRMFSWWSYGLHNLGQ